MWIASLSSSEREVARGYTLYELISAVPVEVQQELQQSEDSLLIWYESENTRHSIHGEEREELVKQYGSWAVGRAEAMCPEDDVACVRQEAERLYTGSRMRRMMR